MAEDKPLWSVVATVDEPSALVQAFVAWYLSLGVHRIHLYFDRPDDPAIALLSDLSQVIVTRCDDAYWLRVGNARPHRHQVRQVRNARDAYARTEADWLLHCDADEFLWPGGPVSEALAGLGQTADALVVPVAERAYLSGQPVETIFDGVFRRPFPKHDADAHKVFGPDFDLTYRGLTGHASGKAFVPTGAALNMSIHRPVHKDKTRELNLTPASHNTFELLHFDGLTPQYWSYKLARKAEALANNGGMQPSKHRGRQIEALIAHEGRSRALHDLLKSIGPNQKAKLAARDLLIAPSFDVRPALARYFPDQEIDLSPAAIDQWLHDNKADVLTFLQQ